MGGQCWRSRLDSRSPTQPPASQLAFALPSSTQSLFSRAPEPHTSGGENVRQPAGLSRLWRALHLQHLGRPLITPRLQTASGARAPQLTTASSGGLVSSCRRVAELPCMHVQQLRGVGPAWRARARLPPPSCACGLHQAWALPGSTCGCVCHATVPPLQAHAHPSPERRRRRRLAAATFPTPDVLSCDRCHGAAPSSTARR